MRAWWICLLLLALPAGAQELFSFDHPAMGTTWSLVLYADSRTDAAREADDAWAVVDDAETLLSNYKADSELSRVNRDAAMGPVTTDPQTFAFLRVSLGWSARSDGAFDITVGPLMRAWGFFRAVGRVPSDGELAATRRVVGWRKVVLEERARTVRFTAAGVELDPGGIGKGWAVDRVVAQLRADGVRAALVSAGSSTIYGLGAPPGEAGWSVRVPNPVGGAALSTVLLRDGSLSTASCAEKHFELRGHQYCHIMDPRLLRPVEGRLQATVMTPDAVDGDALSNVMFVGSGVLRGRVMRGLPDGDRALVVEGSPEGGVSGCEGYRWPGAVGGKCGKVR